MPNEVAQSAQVLAKAQYDQAIAAIAERFGSGNLPLLVREVGAPDMKVLLKNVAISTDGSMITYYVMTSDPLGNFLFVQRLEDVCKVFEPIPKEE